jgi:peptidoglycan/xylan/chitin deacetylase (PgdA/CDA1 family)
LKLAAFRFDVDTHVGMRSGVSNLLGLADDLSVRFTFFVNTGRAMSVRHSLARRASVGHGGGPKLGLLRKLGLRGLLETLILNPRVAAMNPAALKRAEAAGHEVGLHGGRNHATWQRSARTWPDRRLRAEVSWGMGRLVAAGLEPPVSFTSPGWQGSPRLNLILAELGFETVADTWSEGDASFEVDESGLYSLSTNFVGEAAGTGFVSDGLARGEDTNQIVDRFASRLESKGLVVVYDHPVVAGREGLDAVAGMIHVAQHEGYEWATFAEIVRRLR